MINILCIIIAYLIGSLSTGIILSKILKSPDPRNLGSGSAGATNILRTSGKNQAALVLIGDGVKGILAVWIAKMFGVEGAMLGFVALAAVIGHIYPIYFKFKGGRGVATAIASLLPLSFVVGLVTIAVWAGVAIIFRYSSLASLVAITAAPIFMLIFGDQWYALPVFLMTLLIILKHKNNIQRLKTNTESKLQF